MQFTSSTHKTLVVKFGHADRVKFEAGKAEADGDLARKLADFAERNPVYGIEVVEGSDAADPYKGKQAKTLRKDAESRGIEVPEDADRDAIVELLVADDTDKSDDPNE